MHMKLSAAAAAAIFACTVLLLPAKAAEGVTEREKRDCRADYHKYCSEYGLGSNALRACMSRNIKKISHVCVAALVDAGEMTQAQADKLKGKATAKKKPTTKKKTTTKKPTTKKYTSAKKKK